MPQAAESPADKSHIQSLHKQLQSALEEIGMLRQRALAESQSQASLSGLDAEPGTSGMCIGFRRQSKFIPFSRAVCKEIVWTNR